MTKLTYAPLTADDLVSMGACQNQIDLFRQVFPHGATPDDLDQARAVRLAIGWLARWFDDPAFWGQWDTLDATYRVQRDALDATYRAQRDTLDTTSQAQRDTLYAVYWAQIDTLYAACWAQWDALDPDYLYAIWPVWQEDV